MRENIANQIAKGLIFKTERETHTIQKKKNIIWLKSGQRTWIDIFPRHKNGHRKVLNITNHQDNANHDDICDKW